jgi:hypothetical protein
MIRFIYNTRELLLIFLAGIFIGLITRAATQPAPACGPACQAQYTKEFHL